MKKVIFLLLCTLPLISSGQTIELILSTGDRYFDGKQYIKALPFYKEALEQNPRHVAAQYKIAEVYRLTFDYESAEYFYQQVLKSGDPRYPLSGFYYATMKKLHGEYQEALENFEKFNVHLKSKELHESEKYRDFYEQSRIEREGCLLALNEISSPQPDHRFQLLDAPLNSEFNDYAAVSYAHDSLLCITSARKSGKGNLVESTFGESFADLFRFEHAGTEWNPVKNSDKFEQTINTKWGDGSGSFNLIRNKFYFTNCNEELQSVCFIYVSELKNGTWSEPRQLNEYINMGGFSSKHPSLTPGGDTLFFSSNRPGGSGELDLWMSVSAGGDNWGPAVNLGPQINTPFNEVSPFYDQKEGNLFFASNGHRGFGGYDIYMAQGETFEKCEIYNIGAPYNSNKDDVFLFFGEHVGYLSSNRDGGHGKFDIYLFLMESDKEIITEISVEEAIAGRNSLFSDDYDFDTENEEKIDEIISHLLASNIVDVELSLTREQLAFYNTLSEDDKERINRIVNARVRKLTENDLQAIRIEDEFYYSHLTSGDKRHVDNLVSAYIREKDLALSVSILQSDENFYEYLPQVDREKIDQIIALRVKQAESYKFEPKTYLSLNQQEKMSVDAISYKAFEEKRNLESLPLTFNENLFIKNTQDRQPVITASIKEKILDLSNDARFELKEEDKIFYQNLDKEDLKDLERIATGMIMADIKNLESFVSKEDTDMYKSFHPEQRKQLDRILAKMISNIITADLYFAEANLSKNEVAKATKGESIETAYAQLSASDRAFFNELNENDKTQIKRFLALADNWLVSNRSIFFPEIDQVPVVSGAKPVLVQSTKAEASPQQTLPDTAPTKLSKVNVEKPLELDQRSIDFYETLPPGQKKSVDRIIALEFIHQSYSRQPELVESDKEYLKKLNSQEKSYFKVLVQDLRGEEMPASMSTLRASAFSYYNNIAPKTKLTWNRLVASEVLSQTSTGKYQLASSDAAFKLSLSDEQKQQLTRIKEFRFNNGRILSENLMVESRDLGERTIVLNLPDYENNQVEKINIAGKLIDIQSGNPVQKQPLRIVANDGIALSKTFTGNDGSFRFGEVEAGNYQIEIEKSNSVRSAENGVFVKDLEIANVKANEIMHVKSFNIYFDSDSYILRSETKVALQEVLQVYHSGKLEIELKSYTDNIGHARYNDALSDQRSQEVMNFLVDRGMETNDITWKSFGQSDPVAPNNNEYGRQFNRRVEVIIKSPQPINYLLPKIYLVRPEATLYSIAANFNTSVDNIKALNGLTDNALEAYKPIRLMNDGTIKPDPNLVVELNDSVIAKSQTYKVKPGESIITIAAKFNLPEELLMEINGLTSPDVEPGTVLMIYVRF